MKSFEIRQCANGYFVTPAGDPSGYARAAATVNVFETFSGLITFLGMQFDDPKLDCQRATTKQGEGDDLPF